MPKLGLLFLLIILATFSCNKNPANNGDHANVVLDGAIAVTPTGGHPVVYSHRGVVKNIGSRRADFVAVKFVWASGVIDSTFINGDSYTYRNGIRSTSALLPGSRGNFTINSDKSSSGYDVKINWQELDE
jgi:hypothetical protein